MPDWYLLILIVSRWCDCTINETARPKKKSTAEDDDDGIVQIIEEKKNKFQNIIVAVSISLRLPFSKSFYPN